MKMIEYNTFLVISQRRWQDSNVARGYRSSNWNRTTAGIVIDYRKAILMIYLIERSSNCSLGWSVEINYMQGREILGCLLGIKQLPKRFLRGFISSNKQIFQT